jgi:hypothetical protein
VPDEAEVLETANLRRVGNVALDGKRLNNGGVKREVCGVFDV